MKHLKYFESSINSGSAKYIQDFIINVGMFIDSIRKTWDEPEKFAMKMGTTSFRMFIKGEYFHGKDIFKVELKQFDKWYVMSEADSEYFPGGDNSQPPDCVRYINLKIAQEIGDITDDKLEKLSKLRFNINEIEMYLESEKYNL